MKTRWLSYNVGAFLLLVSMAVLSACTAGRLSSDNLNSRFSYGNDLLSPDIALYHLSNDSSELFFSIPEDGLLYKSDAAKFGASLSVHWSLYSSYNSKDVADSGTVHYLVTSEVSSGPFRSSFRLPLNRQTGSVLKLDFTDRNRQVSAVRYLQVAKAGILSSQDFLLTDTLGNALCRNQVSEGEALRIIAPYGNDITWKVRCYFRNFPLAYLPFRVIDDPVFEMAGDSFFSVKLNPGANISFQRPGIYFIQNDTNTLSGCTVMCFDNEFPKVTRAQQLLEATRYITTRKEYERLKAMPDRKKAIDQFWLETGGNYDRARTLIRAYYNRVQDANRLYTSYLEGWKSDRGMIHIIFGQPQSIYRDEETEQWTYNAVVGFPELLFVFRKMNNPFTTNDYSLIRQPVYENVWFQAVDQWRQGRVVNDN
ncbi:MAG: GWxTD domain-containing protein [Bacteroidia bacterium]